MFISPCAVPTMTAVLRYSTLGSVEGCQVVAARRPDMRFLSIGPASSGENPPACSASAAGFSLAFLPLIGYHFRVGFGWQLFSCFHEWSSYNELSPAYNAPMLAHTSEHNPVTFKRPLPFQSLSRSRT